MDANSIIAGLAYWSKEVKTLNFYLNDMHNESERMYQIREDINLNQLDAELDKRSKDILVQILQLIADLTKEIHYAEVSLHHYQTHKALLDMGVKYKSNNRTFYLHA